MSKRFVLYFRLQERFQADTMVGILDHGGAIMQGTKVRLADCDAPPTSGILRPFGLFVVDYVNGVMPAGENYEVVSEQFLPGSEYPFLVNVRGSREGTLSEHLIEYRMAIPYLDRRGNPKSSQQRFNEHQENARYHIEQGNIII